MEIPKAILDSPGYRGASFIVERLRGNGFEAYIVGGAPRDLLLGVAPLDYDVATSARPEQVRALFEKTVPVGEKFGVVLVLLDEGEFEVATFRTDADYPDGRHPSVVRFSAPREDALRRDFTVNALMFDPMERKIIDFVGGREDIRARLIRTVGDPEERFSEDHLRLIRAVRFAARLDFRIEEKTLEAIRKLAPAIARVSVERVGVELMKILTGPRAGKALDLLSKTGLLRHILPEVESMRGCEQPPNYHPEGDVFTHTCIMLDLARSPSPSLALGILLHDVAKPVTFRRTPERIRFDGHCEIGAEMAERICKRLRLSNALTERVKYLVANHLKIKDAPNMRPARLKRLLREEGFEELLELYRLDSLASHGNLEAYKWCRRAAEQLSREEVSPPPLLRGRDLIEMGYRPGPIFKKILDAVETAQLEGEIATPEQARRFVLEKFPPDESSDRPSGGGCG